MYASVSSGQMQSGKTDEFVQLWRDSVAPAIRQLKGFNGASVLVDRDTGRGMSVVLYETKEDAIAVQSSGKFQELVARLGNTLVSDSVVRQVYEVAIQV